MAKKPERLRILDQLEEPDLWSDIRGRQPRRPREEPRTARRVLVAAVALAVAAAAIAFAVRAFEVAEWTPRPASTVSNGELAFSGGGEIFVVSPDGSGLRQVTDLRGHDALDVHWSPDGSKLAFRVWTKGDYELFVANADGSGLTNVTGSMGVSEFAWSPDGSMLAFTAFQEGNDFDVLVVNADGTGLRAVVESPLTEHRPQWSPDGTQIAFERWPVHDRDPGTPDIYTVGLDGGEAVPLVTSSGWDTGAAWSPDGRRIAFSSERDGDEEIYVVNADSSGERKLTDLPGVDATNAAWSPEGTQISFVAHDGEQWDDWVVNADGSGLTRLTPSDRDDGPAVWAPNGSLLAFTASEVTGNVDNTGTYDVYTIRPDGTGERRITSGSFAMGWDLSWRPVVNEEGTTTTPEPTALPEGTITLPADTVPEGTLLVRTQAGAETIRAGSETSRMVPDIQYPLDLSHDGSMVLGSTGTMGSPADELASVDLESGESRVLVAPAGDEILGAFARWSPDGSMVAYVLGAQDPAERSTLCVIARTATDARCFPGVGRVYDFDWAPDASRLVVAGPPAQPVRILDVATGDVSEVVGQEGDTPINDAIRDAGLGTSIQLVGPRWSPSGTYLAALANLRDSGFAYVPVVFTPDGRFVAFGRPSGEFPEEFEWSPVEDVLAYTRGEARYRITEAYVLDPATGEDKVLIPDQGTRSPVLTTLAWAPSGRWLAVGGWVDRGEGHFEWRLRILDTTDPSSFQDVPMDVELGTSDFIAGWGP